MHAAQCLGTQRSSSEISEKNDPHLRFNWLLACRELNGAVQIEVGTEQVRKDENNSYEADPCAKAPLR